MLNSRIVIDLPSTEAQRSKGPIEWVRSKMGAQIDLSTGKEELTVGALSLINGMANAFAQAGVNNAVSLLIDRKVVYMDTADVDNDLELARQAAADKGVTDQAFKEMHLVLDHNENGVHIIMDTRITNGVLLGEAEMEVQLSGRIQHLQIQNGETASSYGGRVMTFAREGSGVEAGRQVLDALTNRVADQLRASLVGTTVTTEPARIRMIRPGSKQIGRFRNLGFGSGVKTPSYRPVPTSRRLGAYDDPFFYYYHDPYYDSASWIIVNDMLNHGTWDSPHVEVIDTEGGHLFNGDEAKEHTHDDWDGKDALQLDPSSDGLVVADSIAEVSVDDDGSKDFAGSDIDTGSDAGGDWGGSDIGSDSSSDSGGSDSSCGSSCSSSSCGSSCGGGCGGD